MQNMVGNVKARKATRKRKERGIIRERSWVGPDGDAKVCWQADFGKVNGKRLMRSFAVKVDAEHWLRTSMRTAW